MLGLWGQVSDTKEFGIVAAQFLDPFTLQLYRRHEINITNTIYNSPTTPRLSSFNFHLLSIVSKSSNPSAIVLRFGNKAH